MLKRIAALDLGTNTFHLLIADVEGDTLQTIILDLQEPVKLGEGGINAGRITEAAYQRGIDALLYYSKCIAKYSVQHILAVGTAALRAATNADDFISDVKNKTGIEIEIISGEQEALYIYHGVKQAININQKSLIMDIGGGSVEFIFADAKGIFWKQSYPIGAAKLMELFHHSDPISDNDTLAIQEHLQNVLTELFVTATEFKPQVLIGSAGAFETFASLCQLKAKGVKFPIEKHFTLSKPDLVAVLNDIFNSTHQERANNHAIKPVRTDMIVVASILTKFILEKFAITSVEMTTYALKEGLVLKDLGG